jgi:hypothetical protein
MVAWLIGIGPPLAVRPTAAHHAAPARLTWSVLSPPTMPPALAYASAVYDSDNQTVVLFGGVTTDGSVSADTWVWDGSTWADYPASQIQAPPARQEAAMGFDPTLHQLILFGGQGADGRLLADTWAWNGASWYQQPTGPADAPTPRQGAAMAYDGEGHLILFGGFAGTGSLASGSQESSAVTRDDTWLWTSSGWQQTAAGTLGPAGPSPRGGAAAAFDPTEGRVILFGGESAPPSSAAARLLGDTWAWTGDSWQRLPSRSGPPGRADAVMVGDDLAQGLVLFSGVGSRGQMNDTWLWDGRTWSLAQGGGSRPGPRAGAAGAFNTVSHRLVVFGGIGLNREPVRDTMAFGPPPPALGTTTSQPSAGAGTGEPGGSATSSGAAGDQRPGGTGTSSSGRSRTAGGTSAPSSALVANSQILHRGDLVTLTGSGFRPGAIITITYRSRPVVVGKALANQDGEFSATVPVPEKSPGGTHHFEAAGEGRDGTLIQQISSVKIVGVASNSGDLQRVVLTAAAFLIPAAAWFVLVGLGWWRRRQIAPG